MSMIEVDPKLFIKCRLCLDETGQYQIVPKVQMQIKYCFDILVEPFDGLPQLVCKKCESILSQYAGIKQIFQEKQSNLKSKLNEGVHSNSTQKDELPEVQLLQLLPQQQQQTQQLENQEKQPPLPQQPQQPQPSPPRPQLQPQLQAQPQQQQQQQQDAVSPTQTEVEHKKEPTEVKKPNRRTSANRSVSKEKEASKVSERKHKSKSPSKKQKISWQNVSYKSYFVCRFCAKSYKFKKSILHHLRKQCNMYAKYSNVLKSFCLVSLPKICSKPNLTGSKDNVVYSKNKIINSSHVDYYVLHTLNSNKRDNSDSSDEDFILDNKKRKRQRLVSRSSNETTIIENNTTKSIVSDDAESTQITADNLNNVSDIECVNIDDSDSASTKSSLKARDVDTDTYPHKPNVINDKMISNIINMCSTKYLNRFNGSKSGNNFRDKEILSLKHKVLSLGRKVIHNRGINATGVLRYMEHKDLEVVWKPKLESNVIISTRLKESNDNENSNIHWEDVPSYENKSKKAQDFIDIYEKMFGVKGSNRTVVDYNELHKDESNEKTEVSAKLKSSNAVKTPDVAVIEEIINPQPSCSTNSINCPPHNDPSVSNLRNFVDSEKHHSKKLLNANPVANPKQLYKKTHLSELATLVKTVTVASDSDTQVNNEEYAEKNNDLHNMPVITSTVSLAQTGNEQENVHNEPTGEQVAAKPSALPKIKVKPVSELMSESALNQHNSAQTRNIINPSNWTVTDGNNSTNVQSQSVVLQNNTNVVYVTPPVFNNAVPMSSNNIYFYPQYDRTIDSDLQNTIAGPVPIVLRAGSTFGSVNREYVKLHTVELPNTKTDAPFQYFQKLLQIHNIHLLDSVAKVSTAMKCLTKFKVVFEQETNAPVTLCLCLFRDHNIFCIKAKDHLLKDLDIAKFSANWQWEILKVFKGDVVTKLLLNSKKFGVDSSNSISYFINLLKSIVYSKVN